jgi:phage terminase large subunit-like protein
MAKRKGLWRDIPVTADTLRALGNDDLEDYLKDLSANQLDEIMHLYEFWARPSQLEPEGSSWNTWLFNAGRGSGKTYAGSNWVRHSVKCGDKRIACVAPTKGDVRRVMVEGDSGLMNVCWSGDKTYRGANMGYPEWSPTNNTLSWDNGAIATFFSAEDPDRLRGPQFHAAWCFVEGTTTLTKDGTKCVSKVVSGDKVFTSSGWNTVKDTFVRNMPVGVVAMSDGSTLEGTFDHPIYTQDGWKPLGKLARNDVCVKLSTTGISGVSTAKVITTLQVSGQCTGISQVKPTEISKVSTYTTSTETKLTTPQITYNLSQDQTTLRFTLGREVCQEENLKALERPLAEFAEKLSCVSKSLKLDQFAKAANTKPQKKNVSSLESVSTAEKPSLVESEPSVVSVVSTWQPTGVKPVYNLQVEGTHEYFANGILTHNCDEVSSWRNQKDVWNMLQFCMRLGRHPRVMVTTTPKPTKLMRELLSSEKSYITGGSTFDNAANLAPTFLEAVKSTYEGTRLGRQELYAEMLEEAEGALWTTDVLDAALDETIEDRVEFAKTLQRVVISIDPAITSNEESDLTGIIVAGLDINGTGYILEDHTGRYTPQGWAAKAISLYHEFSADRIVAEKNQGGDMVRTTLTSEDETVPIRLVHASRGKFARAEPVSALYERGKVKHAKGLDDLEVQMRTWEPLGSVGSPDRLDSMVWAITDLMLKGTARPQLRLAYSSAKGLT